MTDDSGSYYMRSGWHDTWRKGATGLDTPTRCCFRSWADSYYYGTYYVRINSRIYTYRAGNMKPLSLAVWCSGGVGLKLLSLVEPSAAGGQWSLEIKFITARAPSELSQFKPPTSSSPPHTILNVSRS